MYICILMDYFPKGTLEHVLNKCREKKEVIDEEVKKILVFLYKDGLNFWSVRV